MTSNHACNVRHIYREKIPVEIFQLPCLTSVASVASVARHRKPTTVTMVLSPRLEEISVAKRGKPGGVYK